MAHDAFLEVDRVRKMRRRYLGRAARSTARAWMKSARSNGGKALVAGVLGMVLISTPLWLTLPTSLSGGHPEAVMSPDTTGALD